MCQCGACSARQDGGVTRLKNAASCDRIIRSAYPLRSSASTVATPRARRAARVHAEAVHADGRPGVHQLPQVGEVLGVAAVTDHQPLGRHAPPLRNASWSRPFCEGAWVWVVIGTPVRRCASAAAAITRRTSGVSPGRSVTTLSMPARTPVPAIPTSMSLRKNSERVRAVDEQPRAVGLEVRRQDVGGVVAGRRHEPDPGTPRDLAPPARRPARARGRSGRRRCGPRGPRAARARHRGLDRGRLVPLGMGEVQVELGLPDEDVLVDERRTEVSRRRPGP